MTNPHDYYNNLISQGYSPEQAQHFTQQQFPGFLPAYQQTNKVAYPPQDDLTTMGYSPDNAPQAMAAPMGGMMPATPMNSTMGEMMLPQSKDGASVLNWVAMGLTVGAITLVFISMFTNSWMVYEDDIDEIGKEINFGLTEYDNDWKDDGNQYDNEQDCGGDECSDMDSAGATGLVLLWISVSVLIGSLVLICLNNFGVFQSNIGMITAFAGGVIAIAGAIIWLIMFPQIEELEEISNGPGFSFYLAIIGGVLSLGSGACQIKY
tara:strand:- start:263 stop:1054 length:792 start_codon:yes stop_codon:yes gene_type:complete